ncbi:MAG: DNA-3-methyladenine glycosylase [Candidatus Rhabdochlamydia sp.]
MTLLVKSFYQQKDTVQIARDLLGKVLFSNLDNQRVSGIIVETEAYCGKEDKACHAYQGRRTPRTEIMYQEGGVSYLYLCYGIHTLLNIVTSQEGDPHAVLIRALIPYHGHDIMVERRKGKKPLCQGPGTVCQALGLSLAHNGLSFEGPSLWIEDHGLIPTSILVTPRIGIDYAGEDAKLPYRFVATFPSLPLLSASEEKKSSTHSSLDQNGKSLL